MWKLHKILFLSTMVLGTLVSISSYSWLSMWMGLEINLLAIIPLLKSTNSVYSSEATLKYFITQTLASLILLFSIITMLNLSEFIPSDFDKFMKIVMNSALLTKLGAAPFHTWFPEVMEGLTWMNCLIMLTWQKLAPMILLSYNLQMTTFLSWIILLSAIISGILGLNQISLRKILTYSSINHIAWMLSSMLGMINIWMIYFLTYSIITVNIILIFKILNIFYFNQLAHAFNSIKQLKFFFILNFLSLGGLPPFLGFMPKWLTINNLIQNQFYTISIFLIIFTLTVLFFYIRMSFSTMTLATNEILVYFLNSSHFNIFLSNFLSILGLMICTLIFTFW